MSPLQFNPSGAARRFTALVVVFALSALVFTPLRADAETIPPPTTVKYVTPLGAGTMDGSSWLNAGPVAKIASFALATPAGGQVWLRADMGAYNITKPIILNNSKGTAVAPVVIRGALEDGTPAAAELKGNRTSPYNKSGTVGPEVFRLLVGANNYRFSNMTFRNTGNGAFRLAGPVVNTTIQDVKAYNVQRFIDINPSAPSTTASIDGLTVRRVEVHGYSKNVVRLRYDSKNVLLEDVLGDSEFQDGDNMAVGVQIDDTAHDITIRRTTMRNNRSSITSYWNGDGFTSENASYNIRFEDTVSENNADAGYDLKSRSTTLVRTASNANKRNYRFWAGTDVSVNSCTGSTPTLQGGTGDRAQVWLAETAVVSMANCTFTNTVSGSSGLMLEGGGRLTATTTTVAVTGGYVARVEPGATLLMDGVQLFGLVR